MQKVAFVIDGWFMRKRIYQLKTFLYNGENIRKYCLKHLLKDDQLYRIFYYDTNPLSKKGHNPVSKKQVDFEKTSVAVQQIALLESLRSTPNVALRLGSFVWQNNAWVLNQDRLKSLISKKISIDDLDENDVKPAITQKGVDMKMGLDITPIAIKKLADKLVVITGDSDVVPALKLARREGMQVLLDPLKAVTRPDLREHVDYLQTHV
ncbi:NYN domain-containing protein [Desulfatibacillum alkenivorans DSM 16219]|uniref:NYN domain-containing protein n=2 Tax=Desulfatibacillum alkenivorans TaxID=259354 RepID=A0A1M6WHL8_9BACT|nr:NYN domain-containing protein [Desulfatibacillum alkenivorans DSM 16219]